MGQAKTIGESELISAGTEWLTLVSALRVPQSSIPRVSEVLGMNEWVHLACRGLPNQKQPFESAFALHDGHYTIERIIQCKLENLQFAYISAWHTTIRDEESPDEVIHLALAMRAVDDGASNKIT